MWRASTSTEPRLGRRRMDGAAVRSPPRRQQHLRLRVHQGPGLCLNFTVQTAGFPVSKQALVCLLHALLQRDERGAVLAQRERRSPQGARPT